MNSFSTQITPSLIEAQVILATLDQETTGQVRGLWQLLSERGVATPIDQNDPPHISLGVARELNSTVFQSQVEALFLECKPQILISHVGIFVQSGVVWLGISQNADLSKMHNQVDHALRESSKFLPDAMYAPGNWVPHISLAHNVAPEMMSTVISLVKESFVLPKPARIEGRQIVQIQIPAENWQS